jgi:hypothetical protein
MTALMSGSRSWTLPRGQTVAGVIDGVAQGSYEVVLARGVGTKATYSAVAVDGLGKVGKTTSLKISDLLARESASGVDLNGDGSVGDSISEVLYEDEAQGVYVLASGAVVLDEAGLGQGDGVSQQALSLTASRKAWVPNKSTIESVLVDEAGVSVLLKGGTSAKPVYS